MPKTKVYLAGGDGAGWALDIDLRLTKEALTGVVDFVASPEQADVFHSVNLEQLVEDPKMRAMAEQAKTVVAHLTASPEAYFEMVPELFSRAREKNWVCVAQNQLQVDQLKGLGFKNFVQIPYIGEIEAFFPIDFADAKLKALREELKIPSGRYVVGSFQRDSLGSNLWKIKPQKGADILLGILIATADRIGKDKLHVLLAGPRRHWLRRELDRHGISYSFDGKITTGDDYPENIVTLERLNLLTNLIDVYVIPSRFEGGPHAAFETIAAKKKIISTPVGAAQDILRPETIFRSISEAADILARDYTENHLAAEIEPNWRLLQERHSVSALREEWKRVYSNLPKEEKKESRQESGFSPSTLGWKYSYFGKGLSLLNKAKRSMGPQKTINMWGHMLSGPYGGANQVYKALAGEFTRRGFLVLNNSMEDADAHILNSSFFELDKARYVIRNSKKNPRVVHRIDGPICLYRGSDRKLDEEIFQINRELASATAYQCYYSWSRSVELGFEAVRPFIIRNASDPAIFHPPETRKKPSGRKIRIMSSAWSHNMRKGYPVYQYLDEALDFSRFEYDFIGRSPVPFKNIRNHEAMGSAELGAKLRSADIYITASLHDPASNSLLEALNCGLPAIYANSGGHREFAGFAGLTFDSQEEIPALLDKLAKDYDAYLPAIYVRPVAEVAGQYLKALNLN